MSDVDEINKNILSGTEIITGQFNGKNDYERFLQERSEGSFNKMGHIIIC